jgi:hypothetical protein
VTTRLNTIADLAAGDAIPESWVDAVRIDANYLSMPGATLASAATLTITAEYHSVSGTATIDNLSDALGAVAGQQVKLFTTGAATIRNNGAGTGNIRTASGADFVAVANTLYSFFYDGALWRQFAAGGGGGAASSVVYDNTLAAPATKLDSGAVIVAGWAAVEIDFSFKSVAAGTFDNAWINFNGDTGANYDGIRRTFTSGGTNGDNAGVGAVGILIPQVPGATGLASAYCTGRITLINYDNTAIHKQVSCLSVSADGTVVYQQILSGRWKNTAAITSVQIVGAGSNIATGGRLIVRKIL